MEALGKTGRYEVSDAVKTKLAEEFWGGFCGEEETEATVGAYEREYGYLIDTHTAVAAQVMEQYRRASSDKTLTVFVSTASPYKFCGPVLTAIRENACRQRIGAAGPASRGHRRAGAPASGRRCGESRAVLIRRWKSGHGNGGAGLFKIRRTQN